MYIFCLKGSGDGQAGLEGEPTPLPPPPQKRSFQRWTESLKASSEYALTLGVGPEDKETRTTFGNPVDLGNKVGVLRGLKHLISFFFKPFTEG